MVTEPATSDDTSGDVSSTTATPISLQNPGFENQDSDGAPVGWELTGSVEASFVEVETSQSVTGLENDWYTLRAWVRSSGGQKEVYLALRCGSDEKRVHVPSTSPGYRWLQVVVSNQVINGQCTISLYSDGEADTWASFDDIELVPGRAALTIFGADISSLKKSEDMGGVYKDVDGAEGDALQILKLHGLNYARLRVWVDPADGYHDKEELLEMALRLKSEDIKLLVDFHYSDNWADPGKQFKPAAWVDYDFEGLKQALYDHTLDVCNSLVAQGTPPEMIQVGNEINAGLLWPDADWTNFDNMAALLKEGYRAVKDCSPCGLVILHEEMFPST
jgi:arabinogalactan endo-1,4-beta-galactosidase